MHRDGRQEVLAQLREIYDGRFDKAWGTGKELHWKGRLGLVAGVTPVIDRHHAVMAVLGQRFVQFRVRQPDRQAMAQRAMENSTREEAQRRLALAVSGFLSTLPVADPAVEDCHLEELKQLADLVTRARSGVERDGWRRELDYAPEPEMPGRLARQLLSLTKGLALVHGRDGVQEDDLRRVVRVGLDCIPAVRLLALEALVRGDEDLTTTALARQAQYSTTTIRRALEDLQSLELVICEKHGQGSADHWRLRDQWRGVLTTLLSSRAALSRHRVDGYGEGADEDET